MIWRWVLLLRAADIPIATADAARLFLASSFVGSFLPAGVGGDAARAWGLSQVSARIGRRAGIGGRRSHARHPVAGGDGRGRARGLDARRRRSAAHHRRGGRAGPGVRGGVLGRRPAASGAPGASARRAGGAPAAAPRRRRRPLPRPSRGLGLGDGLVAGRAGAAHRAGLGARPRARAHRALRLLPARDAARAADAAAADLGQRLRRAARRARVAAAADGRRRHRSRSRSRRSSC